MLRAPPRSSCNAVNHHERPCAPISQPATDDVCRKATLRLSQRVGGISSNRAKRFQIAPQAPASEGHAQHSMATATPERAHLPPLIAGAPAPTFERDPRERKGATFDVRSRARLLRRGRCAPPGRAGPARAACMSA